MKILKSTNLWYLLLLAGCGTTPVNGPDKYGFQWYSRPIQSPCRETQLVLDDMLTACSPGSCGCTLRRSDGKCTIYIPHKYHPDLLAHEVRHSMGEEHLPHKAKGCPK